MTMNTYHWAWDQALPAREKILLVAMADAAGMTREFDVDHTKFAKRCGIPETDISLCLASLQSSGQLTVLAPAAEGDSVSSIHFDYPLQDFEVAVAGGKSGGRTLRLPGHLYIASGGENVTKIGITTALDSRMRTLAKASGRDVKLVWSFAATIGEARDFEQRLLRMFAASRIKGEWVSASADDVIAAAVEICGGPP